MSVHIARRSFTVDDYYRMAEAGILSENDRVELLEGEVVEMSPIGSHHAACVDRLNRLLNQDGDLDLIVRVQNPIRLSEYSEPQPDVTLLRPRDDFYTEAHPNAADVLMVIKVADTSLEIDRKVNLPLYTETGIPEAVIIVLPEQIIELHAEPIAGQYQVVKTLRRGDYLESESIPNLRLSIDAILGNR